MQMKQSILTLRQRHVTHDTNILQDVESQPHSKFESRIHKRPHHSRAPSEDPGLTVQEKLNIASAEAEAAAVVAGLRLETLEISSDKGSESSYRTEQSNTRDLKENADQNPKPGSPVKVKKTGVKGRPTRRRKSTLTPDELERLMLN